jgi:hypothetical protein
MSEKFENFGSLDFVLCNNKIKNFDFVIWRFIILD